MDVFKVLSLIPFQVTRYDFCQKLQTFADSYDNKVHI